LCIAYLVDPTVVELVHCHAAVEVVGSLTYGRTVFDLRGRGLDAPNAHVAMHADAAKFFGFLMDTLGT
jgi:purine nucleosidase